MSRIPSLEEATSLSNQSIEELSNKKSLDLHSYLKPPAESLTSLFMSDNCNYMKGGNLDNFSFNLDAIQSQLYTPTVTNLTDEIHGGAKTNSKNRKTNSKNRKTNSKNRKTNTRKTNSKNRKTTASDSILDWSQSIPEFSNDSFNLTNVSAQSSVYLENSHPTLSLSDLSISGISNVSHDSNILSHQDELFSNSEGSFVFEPSELSIDALASKNSISNKSRASKNSISNKSRASKNSISNKSRASKTRASKTRASKSRSLSLSDLESISGGFYNSNDKSLSPLSMNNTDIFASEGTINASNVSSASDVLNTSNVLNASNVSSASDVLNASNVSSASDVLNASNVSSASDVFSNSEIQSTVHPNSESLSFHLSESDYPDNTVGGTMTNANSYSSLEISSLPSSVPNTHQTSAVESETFTFGSTSINNNHEIPSVNNYTQDSAFDASPNSFFLSDPMTEY
uniref:Uncharacterized protein n=1 Tax=Megaviridae environmental sample TaxID=1737588 RepID=A0A5J6VJ55_9VIRU|nr:MAG: hypothetical protein [Megaviridae environmental sample]